MPASGMGKESENLRTVALILPMSFEYAQRVRQGVLDWAESHGCWQVIELDPREADIPETLAGHLDGVIVWLTGPQPTLEKFREFKLPVVHVGMPYPQRKADSSTGECRITFDRRTLNDLAIDHFRSLGVGCIGYLGLDLKPGGRWAMRVADLRRKVLALGHEWTAFDLHPRHPIGDPTLIWQGHRIPGLVEFLEQTPNSTGLLCQDDYIGAMVCTTARELGIEIPGHLAVLGQGDRTIGRGGACSLSSIELPGEAIGREASSMLEERMAGKHPKPPSRLLPCHRILVRESTGGLSGEPSIERAKRHFDRHCLDGVTVGELASLAACSPPTLRRRFQQTYGFEISEEARRRRIKEAKRLLIESELDIREIGRRCGFPHPPNFFNFMRRQTGIGPSAYREAHRT